MTRFLLDTNIVLGLVRDAPFIQEAHSATGFLSADASSFLSIVSLGELWWDKLSLDLFWLKDERLDNGDDLPPPGVLAADIVENLRDALAQFEAVAEGLGEKV